jgi:hypothetical protein
MKMVQKIVFISWSALAAFPFSGSAATEAPVSRPGHYCSSYGRGGTDCSFKSYAECVQAASEIDAECYVTARDDEIERANIPH